MTDRPTGPAGAPNPGAAPSSPKEDSPADVRIFTWILALLGILTVVLVLGATLWQLREQRRNESLDKPRFLAPFTLVERSGREVRSADLEGQVLVVNFVFTGCTYSCFQISQRMAEVQSALQDVPGVKLLSLSLDPRSDSPPALADFARRLNADSNRWWFVTGPKDQVYSLIETSFLAKATSDPFEAPGVIPGGFDRAERIALVDARGQVRRYFDGMKRDVAPEIVKAVTALLLERK